VSVCTACRERARTGACANVCWCAQARMSVHDFGPGELNRRGVALISNEGTAGTVHSGSLRLSRAGLQCVCYSTVANGPPAWHLVFERGASAAQAGIFLDRRAEPPAQLCDLSHCNAPRRVCNAPRHGAPQHDMLLQGTVATLAAYWSEAPCCSKGLPPHTLRRGA
jgi:hypothetical protein